MKRVQFQAMSSEPDVFRLILHSATCVVKRSENDDLGGVWLKSHRFLRWSEAPGLSSRVRRAAPSLQMQIAD